MAEESLKEAMLAVSIGEYSESDIKLLKVHLSSLEKKELEIKRMMEKAKNDFAKAKEKSNSHLRAIRADIKSTKAIINKTKKA